METYDSLLDSDPYIQQKVVLERALVRNEAIQTFRDTIIEITKIKFPALIELAQQRVTAIQKLEDLQQLTVQLATAPNQTAARRILRESIVD
jgi:hypothetical protein